jgi:hypothetical protein
LLFCAVDVEDDVVDYVEEAVFEDGGDLYR